jgi:hypothetical protein
VVGKPEGKGYKEGICVDVKIILKWILGNCGVGCGLDSSEDGERVFVNTVMNLRVS